MNNQTNSMKAGAANLAACPNGHTQMKIVGAHVLRAFGFYCRPELGHCDVCGSLGNKVLALEIERAANLHVLVNVARNISQGATHTSIACPDFQTQAAVCRLLDRELAGNDRSRVSVVTFSLIAFLEQLTLSHPEMISQRDAGDKQTKT